MQIKNNQLDALLKGIEACGNVTKQPFRSKCMYNARVIKAELDGLMASIAKPKGWDEYQTAQKAIIDKYAVNSNGNGLDFGDNADAANKEFTALKIAMSPMLDEMRRISEDFEKNVMDCEIADTLKLRFIEETELPRELTLKQCMAIDLLIRYKEVD